MKLAKTLLMAGLFLVMASAAGAAHHSDPTPEIAPPSQTLPTEPVAEEAPVAQTADCEAKGELAITSAPLMATDWQETAPAGGQSCGSCSTGGCAGANRGRMCWLGSGQGWGNCNIYNNEPPMCPSGGWDCQCGGGGLL